MLVIDLYALQTVDVLNFIDDILRQRIHTLQTQNIVRIGRPISYYFPFLDMLTLEHAQLTPFGDQLFVEGASVWQCLAIRRGNHQTALTLGFLAKGNRTSHLGENGRVFWTTRFKQIRYPGQTTGDITGFRPLLRDPCDHITCTDPTPIADAEKGVGRQHVVCWNSRAWEGHFLALVIQHGHHRLEILACRWTLIGIQHSNIGKAGQLIRLCTGTEPLLHTGERYMACHFCNNRVGMRVPVGYYFAGLHLGALFHIDRSTIGQLIAFALAAVFIRQSQFTRPGNGNQFAVFTLDHLDINKPHSATHFYLNAVHSRGA